MKMESSDINTAVVQKACESLLSLGETVAKIMKVYLSEIQTGDEEVIRKRRNSILKVMLKCMSGLCKQSIAYTEYLSDITEFEENNIYKHLLKFITAYKQNNGSDILSDVSTQTDETEDEKSTVKKDCDNVSTVSTHTDNEVKKEEEKHLPDKVSNGVQENVLTAFEKSKEVLKQILTLCNDTNISSDANTIEETKKNTKNEEMLNNHSVKVTPEIKSEENDDDLKSNDYTIIHEEIMLKNESDEEDFCNSSAEIIGFNQQQNGTMSDERESTAQISPHHQDSNNSTDCSETSLPDFTLQLSQDEDDETLNVPDFQVKSSSSPIPNCDITEHNYKATEEITDLAPPKLFGPFNDIDLDEYNRSDIFYETESSLESVLNTSHKVPQNTVSNLKPTNSSECSNAGEENVTHSKCSETEQNDNHTPTKRSRTKNISDHDCIGCTVPPECNTQKRLKKRSPAKSPKKSKKYK